jgi:hypothetical protein
LPILEDPQRLHFEVTFDTQARRPYNTAHAQEKQILSPPWKVLIIKPIN